jgi:hypothetical protein
MIFFVKVIRTLIAGLAIPINMVRLHVLEEVESYIVMENVFI